MPPGKAVAAKAANAAGKAASAAVSRKGATAPTTPMNKVQRPAKLHPVSPTLRAFLGAAEASRTNTVKQLWDYIKTHRLQDPEDPKEINCDEKLKLVLGKERVNLKEIFGLISPHFPNKEDKKS